MAKIILFLYVLLMAPAAHADPVSLTIAGTTYAIAWSTIIATTLAIAGIATGISTAVASANQQKAQARYQEEVNLRNAQASREAAQAKIENQRRLAKFTHGSQLARLGGMGALAEGSPLDVMGQSAGQQEYDNIVTEYEGNVQAIQFQQQAALNKYEADIANYNMGLNITNEVIKGASKIGDSILGETTPIKKTTFGTDASGFKVGTDNLGHIYAPKSSGLN